MTRSQFIGALGALALAAASALPAADWGELLKGTIGGMQRQDGAAAVADLTPTEASAGLKEALAVGVERAVNTLGRKGGYLNDPAVRIPLPGMLAKTEGALRMMGQGDAVDEFIATANRAAERAVPQAAAIVGDAVRAMTITDAKALLAGADDAATQYFRTRTTDDLTAAMLPIVRQATEGAGVTRAYKNLVGKAGAGANLMGGSLDVDVYITEQTLDGLFVKLAEEEKRIRTDPVARSTDLLKKVFGAAQ